MSEHLSADEKALLAAEGEVGDESKTAKRKPAKGDDAPEKAKHDVKTDKVDVKADKVDGKADPKAPESAKDAERGPLSPAQHDGDGWEGLPVQMRG